MLFSFVPFAAAALSVLIAFATLLSRKRTPATWFFFAGMSALAIDSVVNGLCLRAEDVSDMIHWLSWGLVVKSVVPAAWLGFSVSYSRGDHRNSLARWTLLIGTASLPIIASLVFQQQLLEALPATETESGLPVRLSVVAKALTALLLIALVWILMNLEQTLRSAVGTIRWRIKFPILGLVLIFGTRVYVRSQSLVFSTYDLRWTGIESSALLIGCVFLALGYVRTGFGNINVYPSRTVLRSSLTVVIVGGYLCAVGILAGVAKNFGGGEYFQLAVFTVLLGAAGAAVLLFSDRLRQRTHHFVSRHFARAQ
jgi:hypothetical protein